MNKPGHATVARAQAFAESVSHQLAVTAHRVAKLFAAQYAATCKLMAAEWCVLAALKENGNAIPTAISAFSGMDKPKVFHAVANLMNRDLVKQVVPPGDTRLRVLSLTPKRVAAYSAGARLTPQLEASLAAGLRDADLDALHKGLDRLDQRAVELSAAGKFDAQ